MVRTRHSGDIDAVESPKFLTLDDERDTNKYDTSKRDKCYASSQLRGAYHDDDEYNIFEDKVMNSRLRPRTGPGRAYNYLDADSSDDDQSRLHKRQASHMEIEGHFRSSRTMKQEMFEELEQTTRRKSSQQAEIQNDDNDVSCMIKRRSLRQTRQPSQPRESYSRKRYTRRSGEVIGSDHKDEDNEGTENEGTDDEQKDQDDTDNEGQSNFSDMYSRVKRTRLRDKRDIYETDNDKQNRNNNQAEETDEEEERVFARRSERKAKKKPPEIVKSYSLREHKPRTDLYKAPVEDDEQMACLRAFFLKTGRGRRPALPQGIKITNRLLIQLHQLRFEAKATTSDVECWFLQLCPNALSLSPNDRIWAHILQTVKTVKGRMKELKEFLQEEVDLHFISDSLTAIGVTKALDSSNFKMTEVTNSVALELGGYVLKERNYSFQQFLDILTDISCFTILCSTNEFRKLYNIAIKKRASLVKNVRRDPAALKEWLKKPFFGRCKGDQVTKENSPKSSSTTIWPSLKPCSPQLQVSQPCEDQPPLLSSVEDWPQLAHTVLPSLVQSAVIDNSPPVQPVNNSPPVHLSPPVQSIDTASSPIVISHSVQPNDISLLATVQPIDVSPPVQPIDVSPPVQPIDTASSPIVISHSVQPNDISLLATVQPIDVSPPVQPIDNDLPMGQPIDVSPVDSPTCKRKVNANLLADYRSKLRSVRQEKKMLREKILDLSKELNQVKKSKTYKNNCFLKKKCNVLQLKISDLNKQCKDFSNEIFKLKKEKINLQKTLSKLRIKCESLRKKSDDLTYALDMINHLDEDDDKKLNLKCDRYNKFNNSVRLTYMALQGEANVSASNCSKVVSIVANHLLGQSISLKDLPSTSSATNIMFEGNHVAKRQVLDEIKNTNNFTLASDGTSRQKKHYMERHLVLSSGKAISLGFTTIASDDANTMLEQIIKVFDDLVQVNLDLNENEKDLLLKEIVSKMTSTMSDRAANMKLLNRKIHEWRENVLNDESICTHFLYCNAHFLLGLSNAVEKVALAVEKDIITGSGGILLGRDSQQKFSHFQSSVGKESAALRVIRLTADVLGPRGDEKSGSREEWLNYCDVIGVKSKFCSFRSNRFNNVFENAYALVYHLNHVLDFLENEVSGDNLKLQSIVADLHDQKVISIVAAISLLNLTLTGPYWKLMQSNTSYGSFPSYVKKIDAALENFKSMVSYDEVEFVSVFDDFSFDDTCTLNFVKYECLPDLMLSAFKSFVHECSVVLRRQLNDFLDGGVFGGDIPVDVQQILNTCPLTNLTGERLFGDLDFDINKRRHASLHLRSTLNMWKHNKTVSWFCNLDKKEQTEILEEAKKNSENLHENSRQDEANVKSKVKEKMNDNKRKRCDKVIKDKQKKSDILDAIISDGGVCKTKEQLDRLVKDGTAECLRNQIRYRKIFLGEKSLKVTGTVNTLYKSLLKTIQDELEDSSTPAKKRRISLSSDSDE